MPKITLGITGLLEILGRDYGIEKPYWGPSLLADNFPNVTFISVNSGSTTMGNSSNTQHLEQLESFH